MQNLCKLIKNIEYSEIYGIIVIVKCLTIKYLNF
jgi:hypothetical protein